jgi:hypothetical protein
MIVMWIPFHIPWESNVAIGSKYTKKKINLKKNKIWWKARSPKQIHLKSWIKLSLKKKKKKQKERHLSPQIRWWAKSIHPNSQVILTPEAHAAGPRNHPKP